MGFPVRDGSAGIAIRRGAFVKLKTYPVMTFHFSDESSFEVTGVHVRRSGEDKAHPIPFMDRGYLEGGESITITNRGGNMVVTKRGEADSE